MPQPIQSESEFWEGTDPGFLCAMVVGADFSQILQADIVGNISVRVWDLSRDKSLVETPIYEATAIVPTLNDVWFDTVQVGGPWTLNNEGYNFRHYLKASDVFSLVPVEGGHVYRVEYEIPTDPRDGGAGNWGPLTVVDRMTCRPRMAL